MHESPQETRRSHVGTICATPVGANSVILKSMEGYWSCIPSNFVGAFIKFNQRPTATSPLFPRAFSTPKWIGALYLNKEQILRLSACLGSIEIVHPTAVAYRALQGLRPLSAAVTTRSVTKELLHQLVLVYMLPISHVDDNNVVVDCTDTIYICNPLLSDDHAKLLYNRRHDGIPVSLPKGVLKGLHDYIHTLDDMYTKALVNTYKSQIMEVKGYRNISQFLGYLDLCRSPTVDTMLSIVCRTSGGFG